MRIGALITVLALAAAPVLLAAQPAFADGIERPRQRPRARPQPQPAAPAPAQPEEETLLPGEIQLSDGFFQGLTGGVGANVEGQGEGVVVVQDRDRRSFRPRNRFFRRQFSGSFSDAAFVR